MLGLPKILVSDKGPHFASAEFANWCRSNGIVHMTSTPFHPTSYREADRLVGVFKRAMQRSVGRKVWDKTRPLENYSDNIVGLLSVLTEEHLPS